MTFLYITSTETNGETLLAPIALYRVAVMRGVGEVILGESICSEVRLRTAYLSRG